MMPDQILEASFRDPSGFVFRRGGRFFRQVNRCYAPDYDQLMASGLYQRLAAKGMLIPHEEVKIAPAYGAEHYRTLLPEQLAFISYPYEWSFSQLRDAALLTLRVQQEALAYDMSLKDASAYNVQFHRGRPVFIDTLSFERYEKGKPWVAYGQFCRHFLAPLALMSYRDIRLLQLLRVHLDGIPLDLASALLPARTWLRLGLLLHIRVHAGYQRRYENTASGDGEVKQARPLSKEALGNLLLALKGSVEKLRWKAEGTEWADYYVGDSYDHTALEHKKRLVREFLEKAAPQHVWDLGANTGVYSRIAAQAGARVASFDVDPACVDRNYREMRANNEEQILPLLLDLSNPSPAIGWANQERSSIAERSSPDAILALALIHHIDRKSVV